MEGLDEFRCFLSDDKHFIIQPIIIKGCGHSACKEFSPKNNQKFVKCKKCEVFSEFGSSFDSGWFKPLKLKIGISELYGYMFQKLVKKTNSTLNDLKSNLLFSIHPKEPFTNILL